MPDDLEHLKFLLKDDLCQLDFEELYFCQFPDSKYIENDRNILKTGLMGIISAGLTLWQNWFPGIWNGTQKRDL